MWGWTFNIKYSSLRRPLGEGDIERRHDGAYGAFVGIVRAVALTWDDGKLAGGSGRGVS